MARNGKWNFYSKDGLGSILQRIKDNPGKNKRFYVYSTKRGYWNLDILKKSGFISWQYERGQYIVDITEAGENKLEIQKNV